MSSYPALASLRQVIAAAISFTLVGLINMYSLTSLSMYEIGLISDCIIMLAREGPMLT